MKSRRNLVIGKTQRRTNPWGKQKVGQQAGETDLQHGMDLLKKEGAMLRCGKKSPKENKLGGNGKYHWFQFEANKTGNTRGLGETL